MAAFPRIHTKAWQVRFYALAALLVGGDVKTMLFRQFDNSNYIANTKCSDHFLKSINFVILLPYLKMLNYFHPHQPELNVKLES